MWKTPTSPPFPCSPRGTARESSRPRSLAEVVEVPEIITQVRVQHQQVEQIVEVPVPMREEERATRHAPRTRKRGQKAWPLSKRNGRSTG